MKKRKILLAICLLTLLMDLVCLYFLPSEVAVHWSWEGEVNRVMPAWKGILIATGSTFCCVGAWILLGIRFRNLSSAGRMGRVVSSLLHGVMAILSCTGIVMDVILLVMNGTRFL